jgi:nucleoside-diphosphate-sugar epimerase
VRAANVVITGGAGFLGLRLARTILAAGTIAVAGEPPRPVRRLTLLDRVEPPEAYLADPRVRAIRGDLRDVLQGPAQEGPLAGADVVFHLAAALSAQCEADFDLGIEANLCAGHTLLQACRALPRPPCLVFASSLAVYGQWPDLPAPECITDTTLPTPRSSYGVQKFVLEQLVTDYTRKGFLAGRSVRLMTVCVRPGRPNAAASGFLSSIVREPLAGARAVCPVPPDTAVAVCSPRRTVEGLLRAAAVSASEWGAPVAINLPGIRVTVADMVAALAEVAGPEATRLIDWAPDPAIAEIVAVWPSRFETARAHRLGLTPDPDFRSIVRAYANEAYANEAHANEARANEVGSP